MAEEPASTSTRRPKSSHRKKSTSHASDSKYIRREQGQNFFDYLQTIPDEEWGKLKLQVYKVWPPRERVIGKPAYLFLLNQPIDEEWMRTYVLPEYGAGTYRINLRAESGYRGGDKEIVTLGDPVQAGKEGGGRQAAGDHGNGFERSPQMEAMNEGIRTMSQATRASIETIVQSLSGPLGQKHQDPIDLFKKMKDAGLIAQGTDLVSMVGGLKELGLFKKEDPLDLLIKLKQAGLIPDLSPAAAKPESTIDEMDRFAGMLEKVMSLSERLNPAVAAAAGSGGIAGVLERGLTAIVDGLARNPQLLLLLKGIPPEVVQRIQGSLTGTVATPAAPAVTTPGGSTAVSADQNQRIYSLVGRLQRTINAQNFNVPYFAAFVAEEYPEVWVWMREQQSDDFVLEFLKNDPQGHAQQLFSEQGSKFMADLVREIRQLNQEE